MNDRQRTAAEKIYDVLTRQSFADFYGAADDTSDAPFAEHIMGIEDCRTKEEILEEIVQIFHC